MRELSQGDLISSNYTGSPSSLLAGPLFRGLTDIPPWITIDDDGQLSLASGPLMDPLRELANCVPTVFNGGKSGARLESGHSQAVKAFIADHSRKTLLNTAGKSHCDNMKRRLTPSSKDFKLSQALLKAQTAVFASKLSAYSTVPCAQMIPLQAVIDDQAVQEVIQDEKYSFAGLLQIYAYSSFSCLLQVSLKANPPLALRDLAEYQCLMAQKPSRLPVGEPQSAAAAPSAAPPAPAAASGSASMSSGSLSPISSSSTLDGGMDQVDDQQDFGRFTAAQRAAAISRQATGQDDLNQSFDSMTGAVREVMASQMQASKQASVTGTSVDLCDDDVEPVDPMNEPARAREVVDSNHALHTSLHAGARARKQEATEQTVKVVNGLAKVIKLAQSSFKAIESSDKSLQELSAKFCSVSDRLDRLEAASARIELTLSALVKHLGLPLPAAGEPGRAVE